jgi:hypothetical protein
MPMGHASHAKPTHAGSELSHTPANDTISAATTTFHCYGRGKCSQTDTLKSQTSSKSAWLDGGAGMTTRVQATAPGMAVLCAESTVALVKLLDPVRNRQVEALFRHSNDYMACRGQGLPETPLDALEAQPRY